MSQTVRLFLMESLGLIALFLILAHYTGFAADVTAGANGLAAIDRTLQGR
jgi:hypothetical protein